jgi:two-component system cell cycle sensor histidine kinase/response regulator CckA
LRFSRKQSYSPKPVDIAALARETGGLLKKLAGESVLLSFIIPNKLISVLADPTQIEQCLINLIVNARDALEGNISPRIMVRIDEKTLVQPLDLKFSKLSPGTYARLEVSDNGKGIPEQALDKIFEPFYTTKAIGQGTGLGLSIISSVIKQVGGSIEIVSKEKFGTSFTLWFPVYGKDEEGSQDSENLEVALGNSLISSWPKDRKKKILVVDDDEYLLGFLSYAMGRLGIDAIPARNAGEAIIASERHSFSAIVLDLLLPGMGGLELYERLKERFQFPCVFITGAMESTLNIPAGAELLEKPFSITDLIAKLNIVLSVQERTSE